MLKHLILWLFLVSSIFVLCDDDEDHEDHIEQFGEEIRELIEHIEESDDTDENWFREIREKAQQVQKELHELLHETFREKLQDVVGDLEDQLEEDDVKEDDQQEIKTRIKKIRHFLDENRHHKLHEFIKKYLPEMIIVLRKLQKENRDEYEETLERLYEDMEELNELKEENSEMFTLAVKQQRYTIKSELLASEYRETKSAATKQQLLESLNIIFDIKIEMNKREMTELAKELKEIKQKLHKKVTNKKQIIMRRFEDLIGETEFDW